MKYPCSRWYVQTGSVDCMPHLHFLMPVLQVALWLGANVMVEYSYPEAVLLLEDNLAQAELKLVRVWVRQPRV